MNKIELRKMLADLQKESQKIDVWPDDGPNDEGQDVSREKHSTSPPPNPSTASGSQKHLLNRFWKASLRMAFLPQEDQVEAITKIARHQFAGKIPLARAIQSHLLAQPDRVAMHFRLARAVQPTGKTLDPLAATIGAIRLNDKDCSAAAAQYLGEKVVEAFETNDKATLSRIQKLSAVKLRNHRNYQIWIAIDEILKNQANKIVSSSPHAENQNGAHNINTADYPMPTTSEIKRFVSTRSGDIAFDKLPKPEDLKGWTRLWKDSGASLIIPKGGRGRKMSGTK